MSNKQINIKINKDKLNTKIISHDDFKRYVQTSSPAESLRELAEKNMIPRGSISGYEELSRISDMVSKNASSHDIFDDESYRSTFRSGLHLQVQKEHEKEEREQQILTHLAGMNATQAKLLGLAAQAQLNEVLASNRYEQDKRTQHRITIASLVVAILSLLSSVFVPIWGGINDKINNETSIEKSDVATIENQSKNSNSSKNNNENEK
ncbi:hypothetical protein [Vibrio rotiferianus]|uniref:hypothetical protein n=1 Tax=Vibrio rotiferianus TaxID=190895 RepID=UPI00148C9872|nr:hypothetical protein [Vibrio rotiferianus]NOH69447.1 hypothetical protein [Vibrio rotiferianus]